MKNLIPITSELKRHIRTLSTEIGERNAANNKLKQAADYIISEWEQYGYTVQFSPCHDSHRNLIVNIDKKPDKNSEIEDVIICAHYDSAEGSPGANDNASGVALLLALSKGAISFNKTRRTIRFIAFANEELPFFNTGIQGSRIYAHLCREGNEKILAAISLDTIGYSTKKKFFNKGSLFTTSEGIGLVSDHKSVGIAWYVYLTIKRFIPLSIGGGCWHTLGVMFSDHASFLRERYKGMMLTNTAMLGYKWLHTPEDTMDKINFWRLALAAQGLTRALKFL